jgi:hypothetical protein
MTSIATGPFSQPPVCCPRRRARVLPVAAIVVRMPCPCSMSHAQRLSKRLRTAGGNMEGAKALFPSPALSCACTYWQMRRIVRIH